MKVQLRQIFGLLVVGYTACLGASANADWIYDFESPLPASFVFAPIGPPTGTFSGGIDNGVLRLSDPHVLQGGPPLGAIGRETSQVFEDARMSGILNATGTSDDLLGLNLRAVGGNNYGARIEFNSGRLAVFKIVDFLPLLVVESDSPEQGSQPLLSDLDRSYFLQFDVIGNVLDAFVFDQAGGTELLHVHHVDDDGIGGPPLGPGVAGISTVRMAGTLDGAFDNLSVATIPEPSTCILVVVGLAALMLFRRSKWLRGISP